MVRDIRGLALIPNAVWRDAPPLDVLHIMVAWHYRHNVGQCRRDQSAPVPLSAWAAMAFLGVASALIGLCRVGRAGEAG